MRSLNLLGLLAPLACWTGLALGDHIEPSKQSTTGTLEVDLVFPQNDTYQLSKSTPIIFAFHNTGLARYLDSQFTVQLRNEMNDRQYHYTQALSADDIAWDEPYYSYIGYDILGQHQSDVWHLNWTLTYTSCSHDSGSSSTKLVTDSTAGGSVVFTMGTPTFPRVDFLTNLEAITGRGSAGGIAINVTDVVDAPASAATTFGWGKCAVVSGAKTISQPPSLTVDKDAATSMQAVIKARSCITGDDRDPGCATSAAGSMTAAASSWLLGLGAGLAACLVLL